MEKWICALCKIQTDFQPLTEPCPSKSMDLCHYVPTRRLFKELTGKFDAEDRAEIMLSGVRADEPNKILEALSFLDSEGAVVFAENGIKRYTTSNFSKARFYEEVKRLAIVCRDCQFFSGEFGSCEKLGGEDCPIDFKDAFYNQNDSCATGSRRAGYFIYEDRYIKRNHL